MSGPSAIPRNAVFVDTSGWYAFLVRGDSSHFVATRQIGALTRAKRRLVVTNFIASETFTLLRTRHGAEYALRFLRDVKTSRAVHRVRVEEDWEQAAEDLLEHYRDHIFSYVDATSFVAMRRLGLVEVMTFDTDFTIAGFQTL